MSSLSYWVAAFLFTLLCFDFHSLIFARLS
jgi:hypothetical protein